MPDMYGVEYDRWGEHESHRGPSTSPTPPGVPFGRKIEEVELPADPPFDIQHQRLIAFLSGFCDGPTDLAAMRAARYIVNVLGYTQ